MRTIDGLEIVEKHIARHTDRLLSITGEERRWMGSNTWDAIVSGEDVVKAIKDLETAVEWRNRRNRPPQAIGAVSLPT